MSKRTVAGLISSIVLEVRGGDKFRSGGLGGPDRGGGFRGEGSGDQRHQLGLGPLPASHGAGTGRLGRWRALRELDFSSAPKRRRPARRAAAQRGRRLQARRRRLWQQSWGLGQSPERRLSEELPRHYWLPVRRTCAWKGFKSFIKNTNCFTTQQYILRTLHFCLLSLCQYVLFYHT